MRIPALLLLDPICAIVRPNDVSSYELRRQLDEIETTKLSLVSGKILGLQRNSKREERQALPQNRTKIRRLTVGDTCSATTDCGTNEYCMSCERCKAYGNSLSANAGIFWTCEPCQDGDVAFCENGKYCAEANDALDGTCPAEFQGCNAHTQCGVDEYCFSCNKCSAAAAGNDWIDCKPCPTTLTGYCRDLGRCAQMGDSIDATCPSFMGCSAHSDCPAANYCEGCVKCNEYMASLGDAASSSWSCFPCDTKLGGICEHERFCQVAQDSIDGACPVSTACSASADCGTDEYCMDCDKCAKYRDNLENPETWTCVPCPTGAGGACEVGKFCGIANDSIEGTCPDYHGCGRHDDCSIGSFCLKFEACTTELGVESCGERPTRGGFCTRNDYCSPDRSITGSCETTLSGCSHHASCPVGQFCASWHQCEAMRGSGFCGSQPPNAGICLDVEHCKLGLHTPIDGHCPLHGSSSHPTLATREVLKFSGQMNLATFHQAMNVWYDSNSADSKEHVVMQLHDYGTPESRHDDIEYIASYTLKDGQLTEEWKEQTSCPYVEMIVPHRGPYVYEARVARSTAELDVGHQDCSCLSGNFSWSTPGACPRGVRFSVGAPHKIYSLTFVDSNQFVIPTNSSLYTVKQEIQAGGVYVTSDTCPTITNTTVDSRTTCKQLLDASKTISGVSGKWCIVDEGGCAATVKYKMCWASGAAGFVLVASADNTNDRAETIFLADGELTGPCGALIPAVFVQGIDAATKTALDAGSMTITIGPDVGLATPRANHATNSGGLRVYDSTSHTWVKHFEIFGGIHYAETSRIRDVVFVCTAPDSTSLGRLRIFDISPYVMDSTQRDSGCTFQKAEHILYGEFSVARCQEVCSVDLRCTAVNMNLDMVKADGSMPCYGVRSKNPIDPKKITFAAKLHDVFRFGCYRKIVSPNTGPRLAEIQGNFSPLCRKGATRDYHLVDFAIDKHFYTTVVDPEDKNNRLFVYDTTDLSDWKLQQTVHANWEDEDSGLGQVVGNLKGDRHVITWHCSNIYCTGSYGHSAYILDTSDPHKVVTIERSLALPMKEGTFARDVGCNSNDLCMVTLNHDGLVLIDLSGSTGSQIVASHAETFSDDHVPVPVYRMFSGAQKVYPSKKDPNAFFVESATLNWDALTGTSLSRAVSFDSVYLIQIEPKYERGDIGITLSDPVVEAYVMIYQSWNSIRNMLPATGLGNDNRAFQHLIIDSFASATRESSSRFKLLQMSFEEHQVYGLLEILPAAGASPLTIFNMLVQQLSSNNSAIFSTQLGPLVANVALQRMDRSTGPPQHYFPPGSTTPSSSRHADHEQVLFLALLVGFATVFLIATCAFAYIKYREVGRLRKELSERPLVPASPIRSAIVRGQPDSGFVIGRPAAGGRPAPGPKQIDNNDDSDSGSDDMAKETPAADNIQVVGEPLSSTVTRTPARSSKK